MFTSGPSAIAEQAFQVGVKALSRCFPGSTHRLQNYYGSRIGLTGPIFLFSLDCDTHEDARILTKLVPRLRGIGVTPILAVPGEILLANDTIFLELYRSGIEFINHGYKLHTQFDPDSGKHLSCFFYDQIGLPRVEQDIREGHEAIEKLFGVAPKGFRAPHFGTFQSRSNINSLYSLLISMGYRFSTSTVPIRGVLKGSVHQVTPSFWEFPVSGCFDRPTTILDSWSFREAPNRRFEESDYIDQMTKLGNVYMKENIPSILNYYADPSHIHDWSELFTSLEKLKSIAGSSYIDIVNRLESR